MLNRFKKISILFLTFVCVFSFFGLADASNLLVVAGAGKLLVSQKNLLADGNMEASGTSDWSEVNNPLTTKETTSPHSGTQNIKIAYVDTGYPRLRQAILTVGETYRVTGWFRGDGSVAPRILVGSDNIDGTSSTDWQYFDEKITTDGVYFQLVVITVGAGYAEWDDITVTEYTPPIKIRDKQLLTDGNSEASGTSAWSAQNGAVLSKETGTPHSGTQCLRVTSGGSAYPYPRQTVTSMGVKYRVRGWYRADGNTIASVRDADNTLLASTASTDWEYFDVEFTAAGLWLRFTMQDYTAGYWVEFDDIYLTEVE